MSLPLFLQDKRFLHEIDHLKIKEQFIKITVLNWQEEPLAQVQGICISGNLNIDGNSSLRRTATLSILADQRVSDLHGLDSLFAINKKCTIEIGIKNTIPNYTYMNSNSTSVTINYKEMYGDIVWFPLGFFIMFNPSISYGLDGVTISMNLKDKMCLLNGDVGGVLPAAINFSEQDELVNDYDNTSQSKKDVLIYNIIKQLVNHLGNQLLQNIIISEVPLQIKKAVQWNGTENIFLKQESNQSYNYILTYEQPGNNDVYYKFKYKDVIGYVYTDFIWPASSKLECNAGDTITSVLDKIIGIMGNYEYFYDIEGHFIFREKRNFLNMSYTAYWNKDKAEKRKTKTDLEYSDIPLEAYDPNQYVLTASTYNFAYNQLVTNFNNNLNYNNIKNDFVVWGSNSKNNTICRYHLAIDSKPQLHSHQIILQQDKYGVWRGKASSQGITVTSQDWREEIYYQMLQSEALGLDENTERNNTYFQYYAELKEEFPKIYDLQTQTWKADIVETPELIHYYLDFIDDGSALSQYSVSNIGRRAKVLDGANEKINCVFEPVIPDVVYVNGSMFETPEEYNTFIVRLTNYGQAWTNITSSMYNNLTTAIVPNSCFEKIKDLLYQYTNMSDTVSVSSLPIYYIEPNTIISLSAQQAGIEGDYIVQSISLPLDINGTMSMNVYKALDKI